MYVKNVIREMIKKTYVIRDLNENRLVIRDRYPPLPPCYQTKCPQKERHKHLNAYLYLTSIRRNTQNRGIKTPF